MPLSPGNSRAVIGNNIREMIAAGHPQHQAVAAALSNARRYDAGGGIASAAPSSGGFNPTALLQGVYDGMKKADLPGKTAGLQNFFDTLPGGPKSGPQPQPATPQTPYVHMPAPGPGQVPASQIGNGNPKPAGPAYTTPKDYGPTSGYLTGFGGHSAMDASAIPGYMPAELTQPSQMGINQNGYVWTPNAGDYALDPMTGALEPGTQQTLAKLAMRGDWNKYTPPAAPTNPYAGVDNSGNNGSIPLRGGVGGNSGVSTAGNNGVDGSGTGNTAAGSPGTGDGPGDGSGTGDGSGSGWARGGAPHLAAGGMGMPMSMSMASPWWERSEERGMGGRPAGLIQSPVGGRTDHIPMSVAAGSYVLPADIVSGAGQGNSLAGAHVLESMMRSGPYGTRLPNLRLHGSIPRPPSPPRFAAGGMAQGQGVPIVVAGGEYLVPPEDVAAMGGGDLKKGHKMLDEAVPRWRKQIVEHTKKLPGPVKS